MRWLGTLPRPDAQNAQQQQRAGNLAERLNLIEQETAGCPRCGDPVLGTTNGTGARVYLESGSGWSLDVISNVHGRRELRAFPSRSGPWARHACSAKAAS